MANDFAALTEALSNIVQEDFLSWPQVGQGADLSVHERPGCAQDEGFVCLLATSIEPIPFASMLNLRRPEHMDIMCRGNPNIVDGEVVEVYAPGDCLVRAKLKTSAKVSMIALMTHPAASGATPSVGMDTFAYLRMFRRCDFPSPGSLFVLWGNPGLGTSDFEEVGPSGQGPIAARLSKGQACMCDVLEPVDNGENTRLNFFSFFPAEHKWMIPTFAKSWCAYGRDTHYLHNIISNIKVEAPYLVLRLKKCSRGPPLLQVSKDEAHHFSGKVMDFNGHSWIQSADHGSFSFSIFLQKLLGQLGLDKFVEDIYDRMDGRRLVFFQVAIRTGAWREIAPAVNDFFSRHSSAYRHWYGGRAAPNLQVGGAPLFLEDLLMPHVVTHPDSPSWPKHDLKWSYKNTFIHFDDAPVIEPMDLF